jgi:hypothetical protein
MDNYDEVDNQRSKAEVTVVQQLNQAAGRNGLYITSSLIVLL